jgi:hypothetical protein
MNVTNNLLKLAKLVHLKHHKQDKLCYRTCVLPKIPSKKYDIRQQLDFLSHPKIALLELLNDSNGNHFGY